MYLELEDAPYDVGYKRVMIAIPIDIWETIRGLGAANLELVSASDEELTRSVEEQVDKRISEYTKLRASSVDEADMLRFTDSVVFGAADVARERQQIAAGLLHRFMSTVQFTTTLIGVAFVSSTRVLMRKRCPSAVTA